MAILEKGRMADGVMALAGGMDSGRSPALLPKTQVAYAQNVTFRGGYAKTRPSFERIPLATSDPATAMLAAKFQGSGYYEESNTAAHMIVVAGGNVYKLTPPTSGINWTVADITGGVTVSATRERVHMIQADEYLIIQDGTNSPYIYSDTASGTWPQASSATANRVPVGTGPMAYGNGRLWVAQGRNFVAGDILGGTTGILKFTENTLLAGGGSFTVSVGSGDITAMRFVAAPNTALGVGELMVFTSDAAFSVNVPADRNDWYALADPIQRVVLINNGSSSQHSTELVNGDCLFRSRDGIRSLIQAVRDFSQQGNTPISREMSRILKHDNPAYLPHQSGVLFNNRYLLTSMDNYKAATGVAYKGLTVLDFDLISGLSGKAPAAYDGFWKLEVERGSPSALTGFDIYQLAKGRFSEVERCFAFVRNESQTLEIWELKNDGDHIEDKDYSSGDAVYQKISSEIELPSFDFGQAGASKELASADMWVDEVSGGRVDFHCDFHPDQYPCWIDWQDWHVIAEYQASDCESLIDYQKQYRPRMRIGRPPETDEPAAGKRMNYGWEFAARVKWKGHARLKMFRLNALETQEEPYADVNIDSTAKAIACDCLGGTSSATNQ